MINTIEQAVRTLGPTTGDIEALTASYLLNKEKAGAEDAFNILWEAGEDVVNGAIVALDNGGSKKVEKKEVEPDEESLEHIAEIIDKIKHLDGIKPEICGNWLWVSGDTKQHANTLKSVGLKFASKKVKWYWRPEGYKRKSHGRVMSMGHIRAKYGSKDIEE